MLREKNRAFKCCMAISCLHSNALLKHSRALFALSPEDCAWDVAMKRHHREGEKRIILTHQSPIYIIIRHCPGVGAFPRPFCVPNSVALASLTLQVGDWAIH